MPVDASLAFKRYQLGSTKKPQKRWLRIKSEIEQAGLFFIANKKNIIFFGNSLKFEIQERLLILYILPNHHLLGAACASPKAHMGGRKRRRKSAGEGLCALLLPEDVFGNATSEGVLGEKSFRRTSCKARWRSDVCYVVDVNSEHPVPQQRIYKKVGCSCYHRMV